MLSTHGLCLSLLPCTHRRPPGPPPLHRCRGRARCLQCLRTGVSGGGAASPGEQWGCRGSQARRDRKESAEIYKRKPQAEGQEIPWQPNIGSQDVETLVSGSSPALHSTVCAAALTTLCSPEHHYLQPGLPLCKTGQESGNCDRASCQGSRATLSPSRYRRSLPRKGEQGTRSDIIQAPFVCRQLQAKNKRKPAFSGPSSTLAGSDSWPSLIMLLQCSQGSVPTSASCPCPTLLLFAPCCPSVPLPPTTPSQTGTPRPLSAPSVPHGAQFPHGPQPVLSPRQCSHIYR